MRDIIFIGLACVLCLVAGVLGALGYSHYLGEGKQLADAQADLNTARADETKTSHESQQAKSETDALSSQIQQLTATKDDLKKQLDALKAAASVPGATPAHNPMADMIKSRLAERNEQKFLLLKSRLHLTPEQEAAVKAAMDAEAKRADKITAKMMSGGKIDPQTTADLKNVKSLEQTLNDILTPDQKTTYQQMKADEKNSTAEDLATFEMNQISPLLQLSDTQKDQVGSALYQVQLETQDPTWIKNNIPGTFNSIALLDAQEKAKEDALSKILTPDQMTAYHQQAQSQLDERKAMMQNIAPATTSP